MVATQSQRGQEKLFGHEQEDHKRELGAIKAVRGLEAGSWRDEHLDLSKPIVSESVGKTAGADWARHCHVTGEGGRSVR